MLSEKRICDYCQSYVSQWLDLCFQRWSLLDFCYCAGDIQKILDFYVIDLGRKQAGCNWYIWPSFFGKPIEYATNSLSSSVIGFSFWFFLYNSTSISCNLFSINFRMSRQKPQFFVYLILLPLKLAPCSVSCRSTHLPNWYMLLNFCMCLWYMPVPTVHRSSISTIMPTNSAWVHSTLLVAE